MLKTALPLQGAWVRPLVGETKISYAARHSQKNRKQIVKERQLQPVVAL